MADDKVQGLAEAFSLFDRIPASAQEQLGVELAIIGREILAAERSEVPRLTSALYGGLSMQLLLQRLQVRIGLLGITGGRSKLFYGRFVEFGRKAQTVLVQRRRRVNGRLRTSRGRKRAEDIVKTYSLKVTARDPHPFVRNQADPLLDQLVSDRLAQFWASTFTRAEGTGA